VIGVDDAQPRETAGLRWDFSDPDDASQWMLRDDCGGGNCVANASLVHDEDVLRLTAAFDANDKAQAVAVATETLPGDIDLTGAVPSVRIRHVSGGYGADARDGGFDVFLFVYDADYSISGGMVGDFFLGREESTAAFSLDEGLAIDDDFDPSSIIQVDVRIDTKYWDGATLDYTEAVFEIEWVAIE
jgi:hypothetical protein